jgi:2-succinyl-6-hydroxy-2,4-cyclohexadiene-1-carboxylate synthase
MRLQLNGVHYNIERAGQGAPLLLLHGFTGSAAGWQSQISVFENYFSTYALDLLGHGKSDAPSDSTCYRMEWCVADLAALLDYFKIERANVLGYSMGGRVALHFANTHPERIEKLILESASPGLENSVEREERAAGDSELAEKIEREGVDAFVEYWSQIPLFATQARLPQAVRKNLQAQRLQNRADGLANSLRGLSVGVQDSLWRQLSYIHVPTLLIAGNLDQKFTVIAQRMKQSLPNAALEIVPSAGHAVHLERPEKFDRLVLEFLR